MYSMHFYYGTWVSRVIYCPSCVVLRALTLGLSIARHLTIRYVSWQKHKGFIFIKLFFYEYHLQGIVYESCNYMESPSAFRTIIRKMREGFVLFTSIRNRLIKKNLKWHRWMYECDNDGKFLLRIPIFLSAAFRILDTCTLD